MLKLFILNGEPRNDIMNLNDNCDFLNFDFLLILGSEEGVYVMLDALVLNVLSSVLLLDCPSSPSSSTVLGELFCAVISEMKSRKSAEIDLASSTKPPPTVELSATFASKFT
ncbi:unnamed protein product [Trifolium pratense]|uniref:Uncharacterized protein n=1 Tax=Trifolium pratense TaxID=57577 RepID=A0ACB0K1N2_TRIPR|nr:unnamed protein product [Trifolium pratense]